MFLLNTRIRMRGVCLLTAVSMVYGSCRSLPIARTFGFKDALNAEKLSWNKDSSEVAFWNNAQLALKSTSLPAGKYTVSFKASGRAAQNTMPMLVLSLNDVFVRRITIGEKEQDYHINFEIFEPMKADIQFAFTNEYSSPTENRVLYLRFPISLVPYRYRF